ncbi:oxidation resistance protein 1 isoform X18 [Hermetia illucens]|uniref:oxidation resistance protein 1 isoform X18 n=1 Tax=Hermetia illucens TaxID=343691 RepID=UPI0018CC4763|nr:oxidation resistance protein 1 isoform X18 [Hermetia illucens]
MTTLTSATGKYRSRKDWSTNSIPQLVSLEEEAAMAANGTKIATDKMVNGTKDAEIIIPPVTTKPPRRSSLAIGLLAGRGTTDKLNKRRSSLSTFLGRRENTKISNKENASTYEYAMKTEKYDGLPPYDATTITTEIITRTKNNDSFDSQDEDTLNKSNQSLHYEKKVAYISTVTKETRQRRFSTSWQHKLERRRRKNFEDASQILSVQELQQQQRKRSTGGDILKEDTLMEGPDEVMFNRQKRHSWWNIFVPEKQRSRRASQDVGLLSRSADCLAPPTRRSKSRSVDHGLAAPFDLDSLRSKVEGRFESIDRLSKDGDKKKSSLPTIPTITYTVGNRDTLTSVAARFDTTPSELSHLNRLNTSFIFPGQQLLVPDKSKADGSTEATDTTATASGTSGGDEKPTSASGKSSPVDRKSSKEELVPEEKDFLEGLRPNSPKPGHIERVSSSKGTGSDPADDPVITQRFLKINVRHITDGQGVVGGVLLVTPNAVMFDPNVSDPLVIEHGPESYGVIAPMELVVNAAIFHDIAHMRVGGGESQSNEKVEIYYPKSCKSCTNAHSPGKDSLLVKDDTFPELGSSSVETCDDQESVCSNNERDGNAFPKAFDRDRVTPTNLAKEATETAEAGDSEKPSSEPKTKDTTKSEITESSNTDVNDLIKKPSTLEERRKSLLDHHWAIPNKDRSSDEEGDIETKRHSFDRAGGSKDEPAPDLSSSSVSQQQQHHQQLDQPQGSGSSDRDSAEGNESDLSKQPCYDSGIDIRDPNAIPIVQPIHTKKVYSDADIVLSSEWVPPRTMSPTHISDSPPTGGHLIAALSQTHSLDAATGGGRKKTSSVSFSVEDNDQSQSSSDKSTQDQTKKTKMLKRLSYPLTWVEGLTSDGSRPAESTESAPNTGDSNQSVFSKVFSSSPITLVSELGGNLFLSKTPSEESGGSPVPPHTPHSEGHNTPAGRSSIGTFMRPHSSEGSHTSSKPTKVQPKLDYRSMVSIDDMPELFVSFDKLIPRPARACPDPPMYLRLRMGRPIGKSIPLPTSVMSYGKNKLRPEYWFSVPQNRIDELYRFINTWVPHLYGELSEEKIKLRGFELIEHDTEWVKGQTAKGARQSSEGEDITELTRESWEVLSMSTDDYRKASLFQTGSFDLDFPIPDLIGQTEILTEEHREKLCGHLPARAEGYSWSLVFSTSQHGFSLNSLYRKMQKLESPILIVIEDTEHNVFGALTSCSLHVSDHFYGTGESLLYKFNPSFKVFHWTGENLYFIKGNPESLSIGAGDGKFGLWLDGDLNQGRSQTCNTYANEPLSPQEDFVVKTLECWAFV